MPRRPMKMYTKHKPIIKNKFMYTKSHEHGPRKDFGPIHMLAKAEDYSESKYGF